MSISKERPPSNIICKDFICHGLSVEKYRVSNFEINFSMVLMRRHLKKKIKAAFADCFADLGMKRNSEKSQQSFGCISIMNWILKCFWKKLLPLIIENYFKVFGLTNCSIGFFFKRTLYIPRKPWSCSTFCTRYSAYDI